MTSKERRAQKPVLVRILWSASATGLTQLNLVSIGWLKWLLWNKKESLAPVMVGCKDSSHVTRVLSLHCSFLLSSVLALFSGRYSPWSACVQMSIILIIPDFKEVLLSFFSVTIIKISRRENPPKNILALLDSHDHHGLGMGAHNWLLSQYDIEWNYNICKKEKMSSPVRLFYFPL